MLRNLPSDASSFRNLSLDVGAAVCCLMQVRVAICRLMQVRATICHLMQIRAAICRLLQVCAAMCHLMQSRAAICRLKIDKCAVHVGGLVLLTLSASVHLRYSCAACSAACAAACLSTCEATQKFEVSGPETRQHPRFADAEHIGLDSSREPSYLEYLHYLRMPENSRGLLVQVHHGRRVALAHVAGGKCNNIGRREVRWGLRA